jgi:O-antigen/teichoic acid export membrane protein
MGVILKQSRINSIIIASGFLLGAVYTIFIVPRVFNDKPDQWGFIQLILYYAQIVSIFVLLGFPAGIIKFFPFYSHEGKGNNIISVCFCLSSVSFIVFAIAWYYWGDYFCFDGNEIYLRYNRILIPIMFGFFVFEILSAYSRIKQKTVIPFFLNTALQKIAFFILLILMLFDKVSFTVFLVSFAGLFFLKVIILSVDLGVNRSFPNLLQFDFGSVDMKSFFDYSLFNIFGSIAFLLITRIDTIMIGNMLGLEELAYYSIPVFLVSTIAIPEKSLSQIILPVISSLFAEKKFKEIDIIYKKSSINQLLIGGFIFLAIWINIDLIMYLVGEKFGNTTWVFFFLGLAKIFDLLTSVNGNIISVCDKYRYGLIIQLFLVVLTISLNLVFIPIYGMVGAAVATAIAIVIYNFIKTLLVYKWYGLQPFSKKSLYILIFFSIVFLFSRINLFNNIFLEFVLESVCFVLVFIFFVLYTNVSPDLKTEIKKVLNKINCFDGRK